MKILHTADWHLGKKLDNFSRFEEQVEVLEEIINIADQQQVDLVLIAGDLFDNFHPSTEAIDLFYKTLQRLSNNGQRPIVAIAGNHDSPYFIDAPNPLAKACGIVLIGHPNTEIPPFEMEHFAITKSAPGFVEIQLKNQPFPIRLLHTPYANEARLKQYLGEEKESELNQILANNWKNLADQFCDSQGVNLLMAHLYMNKRGAELLEEPEGEKPIKIGNADMIFSDAIPPQIQYTALGHLHGFRNIGTQEQPVIYASSPLCYSFSEAGQQKYVSLIQIDVNLKLTHDKIPLTKGKPLHRKTFSNIETAVNWLEENQNSLVELTLESDTFLKAEERKALYQAHQGIIHLIPKLKNTSLEENSSKEITFIDHPQKMFIDYFKSKNAGQEPNDEIISLFNEILNS